MSYLRSLLKTATGLFMILVLAKLGVQLQYLDALSVFYGTLIGLFCSWILENLVWYPDGDPQ